MTRAARPLGCRSLCFVTLGAAVAALACAAPPPSAAAPGVDVRRSDLKTNVTITVLDTDGTPQTGSQVYAQHPNGTVVTSGQVDVHGHAVIALNAGTYQFAVPGSPSGFQFLSSGSCVVPSCTSAAVTVQKPVQITVVDGWGNPAPSVRVEADDASGNPDNLGDTDAQGHLALSVDPGTYQLEADVGGTSFGGGTCTVPGCTSATIQIQKPVQVTVEDGYGGTRPDIQLAAVDTGGNEVSWATTDATGQASVYVPAGAYLIRAETSDGSTFDSGPSGSCVVPGCTSASITAFDVLVTVTNGDGSPLTSARVTAILSDGTEADWVDSDAQGHADEFLDPGAYKFSVILNGLEFDSGPNGHCVVPGCRTAAINIPPPVVVTVVDGSGNPIASQKVKAQAVSGDSINPVTTDAQGHATFELPPDGYRFSATCGGETFVSGDPGSCAVPGCTTAHITMICGACTGKANGTACNDGDACTQTDTCQSGACVGGNPITCAASDQCHAAGTCDPGSGTCSNPSKANGTACNDGNGCTQTDTCQSGSCTGGNPVTCTAQDQCHVAGTCNPSTGACSNPAAANGTTCNDGNACTQTDTCQSGSCTGGNPVTCTAQDQCHSAGTCDPSSGTCSNPAKANGTSCNDGNACTVADACQGGTCTGTTVTCTAQDQCHSAGTCSPSTGTCSNPTKTDGTGCDDGNACTTGDACQAGTCVSGAQTCVTLTIVQTPGAFETDVALNAVLGSDSTGAVPGDVVTFTDAITNTGAFMRASASMSVTNTGTSPFVWGSYQVTLEYLSAVSGQWVPVAQTSFDTQGVQSDVPPLLHLNFANLVGQTIAPGQQATYDSTENVTLTPDIINLLGDPAEATAVQVEIHLDTGSGTPGVTTDRDITESFTDGATTATNVAAEVQLSANGGGSADVPLTTANVAPGTTAVLTGSAPAPALTARGQNETDAQYLGRLVGNIYTAVQLLGNFTGVGTITFPVLAPALAPQKSGPALGGGDVPLPYTVTMQNGGAATASSITIVDKVNGQDVGAQILPPTSIAAGASATASFSVASPGGEPAGAFTDQAFVTWQDRNGNPYGPTSSTFTTTLALALTVSGTSGLQIIGVPVQLTVTALDGSGQPAPGIAAQLVVAGVNPHTVSLVTGADGTASFSYNGPNLGRDSATVTAMIGGQSLQSSAPAFVWASSVGAPCAGRTTPLDVMLVIDGSPSMFTDDQIEAVQAAVNSFIGDLDFTRDQVGSVLFAGDTTVTPLSSNAATVTAATDAAINDYVHACDGIVCVHGGTIFLGAFQAALAELQSPRHRPNASSVIVFLSDGGDEGPDPTAEIAAIKAAGIRIISLGYGPGVKVPEMRQVVASSPNDYFFSPSVGELGWIFGNIDQDACRTVPPLVSAGGNQGLYEVRLPASLTLQGEVHGAGPRGDLDLTSAWTEVSGPAPVTFTDQSSPVTDVLFTDPGTYVLRLEATDGFLTTADQATVTVDPAASLTGANLAVALSSAGPLIVGSPETLTATLTDAQSNPISNFTIGVTVTGANPTSSFLTTNAAGVATFTYGGANPGTDVLQATAIGGTAQLFASPISVSWTNTSGQTAAVSQGWIGSPAQQSMVKGLVPVTVAAGVNIVSATLTYWPAASPTDVHTLAINAQGGPGATLATFDTTTLPNGSYVLALSGTNDQGVQQSNAILVTVTGDYKPGREVVTVNEFTVPEAGIPIQIGRQYDTLNKDKVGDFGNGWSLTVGHPDLEVDPANDVTITLPNGRRATFVFELLPPSVGLFTLPFLGQPFYVPEPGVFGTLTSDGCPLLSFDPSDPDPVCFGAIDEAGLRYAPTTFKYTDAYGTVYTMGADGTLKSIQDRTNNVVTFAPDGITNQATGQTVSITRDDQGRITKILSPGLGDLIAVGGQLTTTHFEYDYAYDTNGNLTAATRPQVDGNDNTTHYTYDDAHRLLTSVDPLGHPARTSTFDDAGRLATDTDALGNVTKYAYDVTSRTTTTTYPDTGVTTQTLDDNGMVLSTMDQLGRTTTHQYDANRNEVRRTNALGESTTFNYDSNGNQTSSANALGETTIATYNSFSEPLTITNPVGNTRTIGYDDNGLPTSLADNMGPLATFTSSEHGLPLTVTDAAGNTVVLSYDGSGNLTGRTDRLSRQTSYTFDGMGEQTGTTTPRGGTSSYVYNGRSEKIEADDPVNGQAGIIRSSYDRNDNLTASFHPFFARSSNYFYDALNHLVETAYGDGSTIHYTRDFRGNVLTQTDEIGHTTSYSYDLAGQLAQTTHADGTFTNQAFDALGRLASKTDERGNTTTYAYEPGCDCSDRLVSVTDPLGRTTSMTYDGMSRKTSTTDANGHRTFYAYDLRGHLLEIDYADGTATHDTYDVLGRKIASADQTEATTRYGYDAEGELLSVTDPLGDVTQYAYDGDGNLGSVTDANGHTSGYAYDLLEQKTNRTLPLGMSESFAYDAVGNTTTHTDFRGKATTFNYDSRDRLLSKTPDPSLGEPTVSYAYNFNGTRSSMTDASGATTYTYDARNRLLTKATPEGTLSYTYDASGNVASIDSSNENGTSVSYAWDAANQLTSVTDNRLGGVTTAAYTATGQPVSLAQPNGVGATYAYDALDRVLSMAWKKGIGPTLASFAYTYSPRGQRLTSTDATGRAATYGYDLASRLVSETIAGDGSGNGSLTYSIDPVGNRLSRSSTVAALGAQSFECDANDELTSNSYDLNGNATSSNGHAYAFDFENHIISKDAGTITIVYDGDGNRVAKTVGGTTTQYLVDELNPTGYLQVMDELSGGKTQVRYTYGNTVVSQTRNASAASATSFYGYDAHGNIALLTDQNGAETDTYIYDAWGILVSRMGGTANTRLYAGEELDPDLGFINLRARQYDPGSGRFWSADSAFGHRERPITFNRYLYASGDPTNRLDPGGQDDGLEEAIVNTVVQTGLDFLSQLVPHESKWYTYCVIGGSVPGTFVGYLRVPGAGIVGVGLTLLAISSCALADALSNLPGS